MSAFLTRCYFFVLLCGTLHNIGENNSSQPADRENNSEGEQGLANRWNIHPTGEDSQGANGSLPVQETEPDGQVLPENDQQRNADRSLVMQYSCGSEEQRLMDDHLYRMHQEVKNFDKKEGHLWDGAFIWKIREFQQHRQKAMSGRATALYSPAIYTKFQHGYKFCMGLHLNGVNTGVGSHVALFVHMLKGDYDHRLHWPFRGVITLSILEQSNGQHRNDVSESVTASPDLLAFQMPSATSCHTGRGFEKFAPIEQVCGPQYVKNDMMLIRIEIFQ